MIRAHEQEVRGIHMKTIKIIGAALALTISGAAAAATADCCKDMACCKEGADCCKDGKQSDCCHGMKKGGDHAGHDMSGKPAK